MYLPQAAKDATLARFQELASIQTTHSPASSEYEAAVQELNRQMSIAMALAKEAVRANAETAAAAAREALAEEELAKIREQNVFQSSRAAALQKYHQRMQPLFSTSRDATEVEDKHKVRPE